MSDERLTDDDLEIPEITDWSGAIANPFVEGPGRGRNWVFIDGDLIRDFPDAKAVNDALRDVVKSRHRRRARVRTT